MVKLSQKIYENTKERTGLKVTPVNWQDYLLRNAVSQRYYLSVSGRPKTLSYNFSVGYNRKDGVVQQTGAEQYTLRLNVNKTLFKNFTIGTKTNLAYIYSRMTQGMSATSLDAGTSMMRSMLVSRPYMALNPDTELEVRYDKETGNIVIPFGWTVYSYDVFLYITLVSITKFSYASLEVDGIPSEDYTSISLDLPTVDGWNYIGFGLWTYNDSGSKVALGSRSRPTMFPMGPISFKKQSL